MEPGFVKSVSGFLYYEHAPNPDKQPHGRYLFEEPGEYRLKAILTDMDGGNPIESNILTVRVKQPTAQDGDAYRFIQGLKKISDRQLSYGYFLMTSFGRNTSVRRETFLAKREEFIAKFPKSGYTRYAEYAQGLTYSRRENEQQRQEGIRLLERASRHGRSFVSEMALRELKRVHEKREEAERAEEYQAEMAERFPDSSEARDYLEKQVSKAAREKRAKQKAQQQAEQQNSPQSTLPLGLIGGAAAAVLALAGAVLLIRKKATPPRQQ
jgi:hypothetical protein